MDNHENNPKSIKYYVKRFIQANATYFKGKKVVDLPAGNGVTSRILDEVEAEVIPFDLFPEYFNYDALECKRADVLKGMPLEDDSVDYIICQEGIEHFTDQFKALQEFNRILKKGGSLLITTPNYSNLQSRFSYFLSESERFNQILPPNEIDSIWMNNQTLSSEIYFGHVFLIGVQKLRVLSKLAGFNIKRIIFTRARTTSIILLILSYPLIYLSNLITYFKNIRKLKSNERNYKKKVYREVFKLSVNIKLLIDSHLFIEFEKCEHFNEVMKNLKSVHQDFSNQT